MGTTPHSTTPCPPTTESLIECSYDELRHMACRHLRRQPPDFTLQVTDVVNEALLCIIRNPQDRWNSVAHFQAIMRRKIAQVITDHLRKRGSIKRGGARSESAVPRSDAPPQQRIWRRVPMDDVSAQAADPALHMDLADALEALAAESRRLYVIVMLHWLLGLTHAEIGRSLRLSASTVEKNFRYALTLLNRVMVGYCDRPY